MKHEKQVEILAELLAQIDEKRNVDAGIQMRMPTDSYHDAGIADREWAQLFRGHPQLVGLSGDLPEAGSYFTTDDFGLPVLAVRGRDGTFRAFLNACRHRGVRVAGEPRGRANAFTCPFHAWTYSNQGDLVAIPQQDHFGPVDKACNGLVALPAEEWNGMLWVHPEPGGHLDVPALLGVFADELAALDLGALVYSGESVLDMKLNWKLANDTFGETYHFQKLHKDTLGRIFYGDNLSYETSGRNHRFVFASKAIDMIRDLPREEWNIHWVANVLYYLFPNIQFNVGGGGNISMIRIYPHPDGPGRSVTRVGHYFTRETIELQRSAEEQGLRVATADDVYEVDPEVERVGSLESTKEVFVSTIEQEDYLMGESTQRAVASGLMPTMTFGRNEPALHHYHRTFAEALQMPGPEVIEPG
jgi:phenylpropionate dioxygenase-like ring-hydroxylating dioxygenase large terminal subunit